LRSYLIRKRLVMKLMDRNSNRQQRSRVLNMSLSSCYRVIPALEKVHFQLFQEHHDIILSGFVESDLDSGLLCSLIVGLNLIDEGLVAA